MSRKPARVRSSVCTAPARTVGEIVLALAVWSALAAGLLA